MGFDIQRFVEENIDQEFICNICHDVLEDPLMVANCQHLFCSKCIRDCIKVHGICPQDRSPVSINKLVEPIRLVRNLINKLKIRCKSNSDGCDRVLPVGQLHDHYDRCEANPENKGIKCFCEVEFGITEWDQHKQSCLDFQKNELSVMKIQLSTYSSILCETNESLADKVTTDSEIKFLHKRFKQSLANSTADFNAVQRTLLYINGKLLNHEIESEKDLLSTIRYVKYGFEDLAIATKDNYDNCCDFATVNGVDYLILCESLLNNKHINRHISTIVKSLSQYEDLLPHMMNRKCIRMLLTLMNERTVRDEIEICINSATALAAIVMTGTESWDRLVPDYNRQSMLNQFQMNVAKWRDDRKLDLGYQSLKDLFDKLKSDKSSPEILSFYTWILSHLIKSDTEKYIPMIERQNGIEFLQTLYENPRIGSNCKRNMEFVINQCNEWKKNQEIR